MKAIRKTEVYKKLAKFQLNKPKSKQPASPNPQLHKTTRPNSGENRNVGNIGVQVDCVTRSESKTEIAHLDSNSNFAAFTKSKFAVIEKQKISLIAHIFEYNKFCTTTYCQKRLFSYKTFEHF